MEELGELERGVEDRVQTTTSANETRCARMTNNAFEGHMICSSENGAQSWATRESDSSEAQCAMCVRSWENMIAKLHAREKRPGSILLACR